MRGSILVCGTHSDAGKSAVVAGLCRWLRRAGVRVAPFKAQNMSLNSVVTGDGAEVARSQAVQAAAAGIEPEAAMNPILLKPSGERRSQLIVMGRPRAEVDARGYLALKERLQPVIATALASLRERFEVVVCEGAGSCAEVNLRSSDLVNLGLAADAGLPVLIVADIDRGGVFASLVGTLALADPRDQAHIAGFVINRFRGDRRILAPGLHELQRLTGRPVLGVLPHVDGLSLDAEDSLDLARLPAGEGRIEVAVVRHRWISNFTDVDALIAEPDVSVRFTRSPAEVERADLVILPGTKATVQDLERMRADGLEGPLRRRAAAGRPTLGICGGYQMLGERIIDRVESGRGEVRGLGLLPVTTTFERDKLLRRRVGHCGWLGTGASGYEIRHGRVRAHGGEPLLLASDGEAEGCRLGSVLGLSWHGALEHDGFRRAFLRWVSPAFTAGSRAFSSVREARLELLGDLVEEHLDLGRVGAIINGGPPRGLPVLRTELSACCAC